MFEDVENTSSKFTGVTNVELAKFANNIQLMKSRAKKEVQQDVINRCVKEDETT